MGGIGTDLKPGKYTLTPLPALKIWKVEGPNVKSGLRFDLTLDDADPWTLSYPDKLPLVVTAGSETDPATIEDMIDPTTGELKDPLALFEGMPMQEPVSGIDDFEDARYDPDYKTVQKNFSKFLIVHYRDNTRRDINIDDIKPDTPRLFAMKQEVLVIMDEYLFMQILVSFPAVFFVLTMMPFATSPTAGARPRYVVSRQVFSKSSGARLSGEPGTAPGQLKSRAPAEPPAPAEAPKAPVEPSKAPAEPPKAPAEAPKAETEPSKVPAESPQTQANPATRAPGNIVAQKIADPNATVGSGTRWSGKGPEPQWKNPKSTKAYDHIESTHGPKKNQKDFEGRLASTGDPQGQWYDANDWVVAENAAPKQPGTYIIDFGRPVGRVFAQKGSPPIENVTRAFVQRNPDGTLNSAYPVTDSFTLK